MQQSPKSKNARKGIETQESTRTTASGLSVRKAKMPARALKPSHQRTHSTEAQIVRKAKMPARALKRSRACVFRALPAHHRPKSKNARKGIETVSSEIKRRCKMLYVRKAKMPARALKQQLMHLLVTRRALSPKSKNARKGIETHTRPPIPALAVWFVRKAKMPARALKHNAAVLFFPVRGIRSEKQKCPQGH